MEIWKKCKNGHKFGCFLPQVKCPYCKEDLFISYEFSKKEMNKISKKTKSKRNILASDLPWLPWLNEVMKDSANSFNVENNYKRWTISEVNEVKEIFNEYGVNNYEFWKEIAENQFGRSLYAIEQILRYVIAAKENIINIEEYFKE